MTTTLSVRWTRPHLDTPRRGDELVMALDSSWNVVEEWLNRWTPETLQQSFSRQKDGRTQWHSYQMVFMRLVMHDAYHMGEVSLILGMDGLDAIEPWSGLQLASPPPGRGVSVQGTYRGERLR